MSSGSLSWDEPKEHFLLYIDLLGISRAFLNPYTPERTVVQEVTDILYDLNSWTDIFDGRKDKFSISDSLLALFPHTSEGLQDCVILARNLLLLSLGREFKFPLRGAISHGYMSFPTQTFKEANGNAHNYSHMMGAALVRAHSWERIQNWVGISLTPETCEDALRMDPLVLQSLEEKGHLKGYPVPTKSGSSDTLSIIPFDRSGKAISHDKLLDYCRRQQASPATDHQKWKNLEIFAASLV